MVILRKGLSYFRIVTMDGAKGKRARRPKKEKGSQEDSSYQPMEKDLEFETCGLTSAHLQATCSSSPRKLVNLTTNADLEIQHFNPALCNVLSCLIQGSQHSRTRLVLCKVCQIKGTDFVRAKVVFVVQESDSDMDMTMG